MEVLFSSVKARNRLTNKGMSKLLKSYYSEKVTYSQLRFSKFRKFVF